MKTTKKAIEGVVGGSWGGKGRGVYRPSERQAVDSVCLFR